MFQSLQDASERRRHTRIPLKTGVHCNTIKNGQMHHILSSLTENLGAGGLAVHSNRAVQKGQGLIVSVFLPLSLKPEETAEKKLFPIIARTRVAWCDRTEAGFQVGLEFLELNSYSRKLFQRFLSANGLEYEPPAMAN